MDPRQIATTYYEAWRTRAGDMTGVPLADDFTFRGPVANFDTADSYRAMAREAGAAVRDFQVRPPVHRRRPGLLGHRLADGAPARHAHRGRDPPRPERKDRGRRTHL